MVQVLLAVLEALVTFYDRLVGLGVRQYTMLPQEGALLVRHVPEDAHQLFPLSFLVSRYETFLT